MSAQDIESSITDLMSHMKSMAPKLRPQILPCQFSQCAHSILQICCNENQRAAIVSFLSSQDMDDENIALQTEIDLKHRKIMIHKVYKPSNPIDNRILSLEQLMKAFVTSSKEEMLVLNERFLDANKLHGDSYDTSVSSSILQSCSLLAFSASLLFIIFFILLFSCFFLYICRPFRKCAQWLIQ